MSFQTYISQKNIDAFILNDTLGIQKILLLQAKLNKTYAGSFWSLVTDNF